MGMSEPKRKVKYSIDPNSLNWANDESKFGKRLMEKMGWEKGKGLGANLNGMTENIKIKFKDDSKGVGYKKNYDNVWLSHQDNFDDLLSQLQQTKPESTETIEEAKKEENLKSLEEHSKNSRARVHYKKFTKSKDLTNATKNDLDCILGRHKRKKHKQEEEEEEQKVEEEVKDEKKEAESSFVTVTNTLSINEYFAKKMAFLAQKRSGSLITTNDNDSIKSEVDETREVINGDVDVEIKEKRKKKKHIEVEEELPVESIVDQESENVEAEVEPEPERKKKKKKKNKDKEQIEEVIEEVTEIMEVFDTKVENKNSSRLNMGCVFDGSNLAELNGYTPYMVTSNVTELLDDKEKRSRKKLKKLNKTLLNDADAYNYLKKPMVNLNKDV